MKVHDEVLGEERLLSRRVNLSRKRIQDYSLELYLIFRLKTTLNFQNFPSGFRVFMF